MFMVTPHDIIAFIVAGLVLAVLVAAWALDAVHEAHCKHDGEVGETSACDAICRKCGKNLGFIGAWRERHPKN